MCRVYSVIFNIRLDRNIKVICCYFFKNIGSKSCEYFVLKYDFFFIMLGIFVIFGNVFLYDLYDFS